MMINIVNVHEYSGGIDKAINYIHSIWGKENNFEYYKDAIMNSTFKKNSLPRFYLLIKDESIIGCCGLITNDFISRHDLYPWLSSLYVEEQYRGNAYARLLMAHIIKEAKSLNFERVYLTTNHINYYEKYGWKRIEDGIDLFNSKPARIYMKEV